MIHARSLALAIVATASLATGAAAQSLRDGPGDASPAAASRPLDGTYRGMYVCETPQTARDILHAPLDLTVHDGNVLFARPLFNFNATRVVGSEIASGTIDRDGKLHASSTWKNGGLAFRGEYSGTLTPGGGTFMGTQSWRGGQVGGGNRTCTAAVVAMGPVAPAASDRWPQTGDQRPAAGDQ